jgi:uncharacterized protein
MRYTIAKTRTGNEYLFSFSQKRISVCPPIVKALLKNESDINRLMKDNGCLEIDGKRYSTDEVNYYLRKIDFLKNNHYYDDVTPDDTFSFQFDEKIIKEQFSHADTILFEVTEKCNLRCLYCVYGQYYSVQDDRQFDNLEDVTANSVLDFFIPLWEKQRNKIYKNITIGFYGGEPLLNFSMIATIVDRLDSFAEKTGVGFQYIITTNGVLIDRYIDFLYKHKFRITISLDGDEEHDQYRVFPNGRPSYHIVVHNILQIKDLYPEYYDSHIIFNSVLHDKNDEVEVTDYMINRLGKKPIVSEAKPMDKTDSSKFVYAPKNNVAGIEGVLDIKKFLHHSIANSLLHFITAYGRDVKTDCGFFQYYDLNSIQRHPTGVCVPFSKKVFITAHGKILPSERINFKHTLGAVTNGKIIIDYSSIADSYNNHFLRCKELCSHCFNFFHCQLCLFNDVIQSDETYRCHSFQNERQHGQYIGYYWSFFEQSPFVYYEILNNLSYE